MKSPRNLLRPVVAILSVMNATAQTRSKPISSHTLDWNFSRHGQIRYLRYLPADYGKAGDQRWPLMLFLHGSDERGTD